MEAKMPPYLGGKASWCMVKAAGVQNPYPAKIKNK